MEVEHLPTIARYVSDERHVTIEQAALAEMAYRLSSSNRDGEAEDGDVSVHREAKLLMSLSAFPQTPDQSDLELISSESDNSYLSDSSRSNESFTFVCPSLSLENRGSSLQHAYRSEKRNQPRKADEISKDSYRSPAKLLGRPLKADDRDAVCLSADAMARNVRDSFRKAIEWRIASWTETLSKALARKEKIMLANGATKKDLQVLLKSSEASVILGLRNMKDRIKVSGTETTFTVLPQRAEKANEHLSKKRRVVSSRPYLEEGEYQYTVAHAMRLECMVEFETPAGPSQVSLEVPGTIEGTFLSSGFDREDMLSVLLDINTDMLAAMVEKACRKIVRLSLEAAMKAPTQTKKTVQPQQVAKTSTKKVDFAIQGTPKPKPAARSLVPEFATPSPKPAPASAFTPEAVRAAIISPASREVSNDSTNGMITPQSNKTSFLSPIPDDFESFTTRRIKPQPRSGSGFKGTFASINSLQTSKVPRTKPSAMVSPPPQESEFVDTATDNGPSLPMLVEAACRAFTTD